MYFHREESWSAEEMARHQLQALQQTLRYAYHRVDYFRQSFDAAGFHPDQIQSLADIRRVPFIEKSDLRKFFPFGLLAAPRTEVYRYHFTSGTTGTPVTVPYTRRDWQLTARMMARSIRCVGGVPGDLFYSAYGQGMWIGGPTFEAGLLEAGVSLLPVGAGRSTAAVHWLKQFQCSMLGSTPSFALHLLETAAQEGIDPKRDWPNLRIGMFGGEPWTVGLKHKIESRMPAGFRAFNVYGSTEGGGPIVAVECPHSTDTGYMHVWSDRYFVEIIDPETTEPCRPGERGELVLTTLGREGCPMVRWRTRDLTMVSPDAHGCPCGRAGHLLLQRFSGRSDDMLKVRGAMVFPSSVEDVLARTPGTADAWCLYVDKDRGALEHLTVSVEPVQQVWASADSQSDLRRLLEQRLRDRLGVRAEVVLAEPGSLPRSEGKSVRIYERQPAG